MKKWWIALLAIIMLAGISPAGAMADPDVVWDVSDYDLSRYFPEDIEGHWAELILADFVQAHVLNGYEGPEGEVVIKPDNTVTRAEFVKLFMAVGLEARTDGPSFTDVRTSDWFYIPVMTASSYGLVNGVDSGVFAPGKNITRAEIGAMLVRHFEGKVPFDGPVKSFSDTANHWAKAYIEKLSKAQIIDGYGNDFGPDRLATRAEAAAMIQRALQKETANLPQDQTLIEAVKQYDQQLESALEKQDFGQARGMVQSASYGFYQAASMITLGGLKEGLQSGEIADVSIEGQASYKIIRKSAHYATVERKGLKMKVTVNNEGNPETIELPLDEMLSLKLIDIGWLIYGANLAQLVGAEE